MPIKRHMFPDDVAPEAPPPPVELSEPNFDLAHPVPGVTLNRTFNYDPVPSEEYLAMAIGETLDSLAELIGLTRARAVPDDQFRHVALMWLRAEFTAPRDRQMFDILLRPVPVSETMSFTVSRATCRRCNRVTEFRSDASNVRCVNCGTDLIAAGQETEMFGSGDPGALTRSRINGGGGSRNFLGNFHARR